MVVLPGNNTLHVHTPGDVAYITIRNLDGLKCREEQFLVRYHLVWIWPRRVCLFRPARHLDVFWYNLKIFPHSKMVLGLSISCSESCREHSHQRPSRYACHPNRGTDDYVFSKVDWKICFSSSIVMPDWFQVALDIMTIHSNL